MEKSIDRISRILKFLEELDKFKSIVRLSYLWNENRREDDAQHTWHILMILMTLEKELDIQFDVLKTMKMCVIHDLWEIYTWDVFLPFEDLDKDKKDQIEKESFQKLVSLLPDDIAQEFLELYDEYSAKKTVEAKIVKAIDQIQYYIQYKAWWYKYYWKEENKYNWTLEKEKEYGYPKVKDFDIIKEIFDRLMEDSEKNWAWD